jgi:hypothetical protein
MRGAYPLRRADIEVMAVTHEAVPATGVILSALYWEPTPIPYCVPMTSVTTFGSLTQKLAFSNPYEALWAFGC